METIQNLEVNKSKLNVGFFFLSLGVLITLITTVVSFLNLVFSTLDKQFPDVLNSSYQYGYSTYDFESIRTSLATLIIFFPIFILVSFFWKKFIDGEMSHIDEIIKKWVISIVLFLSALVVAIDLVTLVRYFVSGEITNRFVYKVLSTLIVLVLVGFYYILLLKIKKESKLRIGLIFGSIGIIVMVISIFYSFSIMGSPAKQRLLRLDDKRLTDLQGLQYQIINYWQQKEKLPTELSVLSNSMTGFSLPVPPEFAKGEKYEYRIVDSSKLSFELCADFALPIPKGWREGQNYNNITGPSTYNGASIVDKGMNTSIAVPTGGINEIWDHQSGRTCFVRVIDKDIYPPIKK